MMMNWVRVLYSIFFVVVSNNKNELVKMVFDSIPSIDNYWYNLAGSIYISDFE